MKANELRLWNTISICDKPIPEDYRTVDIKMLQSIMGGYQMYGIPLTPEILEKCGFVLKYNTFYTKDNIISLAVFDGKLSTTYVCCDNQVNQVKYLHQLQNLYFCLVGEELEVKL